MSSTDSPANELDGMSGNKSETMVSNDSQQASPPKPIIQNISPRTISGVLSQFNQNSMDWSANGLIAFGSHNCVIVVDSLQSLKVCQTLHRHKSSVCLIRWCDSTELKLCSVDTNGLIVIWDVTEGSVLTVITATKELKTIQSIQWINLNTSSEDCVQNFLLVLYRNNSLLLYETEFEEIVWTKKFELNVNTFCLDPFDKTRVLFVVFLLPGSPFRAPPSGFPGSAPQQDPGRSSDSEVL